MIDKPIINIIMPNINCFKFIFLNKSFTNINDNINVVNTEKFKNKWTITGLFLFIDNIINILDNIKVIIVIIKEILNNFWLFL